VKGGSTMDKSQEGSEPIDTIYLLLLLL